MGEAGNRTVFVGNLAWNTTADELRDFMASVGTVLSSAVQCHADSGRSKGWGLVEYSTDGEAMAAIEQLNNAELGGRAVHVRLDRSNIDTSGGFAVFVGNLPWSTTTEDLQTLFAQFQPYDVHVKTNMAGRSRGFAILRFSAPEPGQQAIAAMNGFDIDGRPIQVREDRDVGGGAEMGRGTRRAAGRGAAEPRADAAAAAAAAAPRSSPPPHKQEAVDRCTVFVGNLAWGTTNEDLVAHFVSMSGMLTAEVQYTPSGRSKGWGLVTFAEPEQALAAVELLAESTLHERRLTVRLDRK
ncbi:hypothetical protein JKP88DRAFT_191549 [Tribonema minus]|uniref:RRM domain-containing protein n=1 Tax=Tribonema minus TaxID=303371 RepID=A0A835ZG94_9STRA|nr:hypothetical protein JKP88DRAFT_191549 [Tribonema minus]